MSSIGVARPTTAAEAVASRPEPHGAARRGVTLIRSYPYHWAMAAVATAIIVVFFQIYFRADVTTAFLDGTARLNLARRVLDNAQGTPSVAQLGGVWLPLMPALESTMAWSDTLYRNGLAGSLISMVSFVALVVLTFDIVRSLTGQVIAGVAAALVLLTNLNILLFGTSTMAEMLLMAVLTACGLCVLRIETSAASGAADLRWIALGSLAFALACLTRYEGYFVTAGAVPLMALLLWRRGIRGHQLVATIGTLFSIPLLTIAGWLVYEWVIYGDPLYFMRSEYSAREIDVIGSGNNQLAGNPLHSAHEYLQAVRWSYADFVLALALFGVAMFAIRFWRTTATPLAPVFFLLIPAFYLASLVFGQIGLDTGTEYPYNVRYGIPIGVTLAVFAGYGVGQLTSLPWRKAGIALAVATIAGMLTVGLPSWQNPIENTAILQDNGTGLPDGSMEMAAWLEAEYSGGRILLEGFGWDKAYVQANSGIPLREFLTEAAPEMWQEALDDPVEHVDWIYIGSDPDDAVGRALATAPELTDHYLKVFENPAGAIYRLQEGAGHP